MSHSPGPWVKGNTADSIITKNSLAVELLNQVGPETLAYYGGGVIAESVHPQNQALIMAAPTLLEVLKRLVPRAAKSETTIDSEFGDCRGIKRMWSEGAMSEELKAAKEILMKLEEYNHSEEGEDFSLE